VGDTRSENLYPPCQSWSVVYGDLDVVLLCNMWTDRSMHLKAMILDPISSTREPLSVAQVLVREIQRGRDKRRQGRMVLSEYLSLERASNDSRSMTLPTISFWRPKTRLGRMHGMYPICVGISVRSWNKILLRKFVQACSRYGRAFAHWGRAYGRDANKI
jgi:hypothetical protein